MFPGDDIPVIRGSAKLALEGDQSEYGVPSVLKLYRDDGFLLPGTRP